MNNQKIIYIKNDEDFNYLLSRIINGPVFADSFNFESVEYFQRLLSILKIDESEFNEKYYYFNDEKNIHISQSEFNFIWISTMGLVAKDKATDNKYVNACLNQFTVVEILFEKAYEIMNSENAYDVDGYYHGYLSQFNPALFNNILFYIEVFGKAYLNLCNVKVPATHNLKIIYDLVVKTVYKNNHNNTVFQAKILNEFLLVIKYIQTIPNGFKEHFVKYDDNPDDGTVIMFKREYLRSLNNVIEMSNDFIFSLYYEDEDVFHLKTGLLERLLEKAENELDRQQVLNEYGYMADISKQKVTYNFT